MKAEKNCRRPAYRDRSRTGQPSKKNPQKESSKDEFLVERREYRPIRDDGKLLRFGGHFKAPPEKQTQDARRDNEATANRPVGPTRQPTPDQMLANPRRLATRDEYKNEQCEKRKRKNQIETAREELSPQKMERDIKNNP